MYSFTAFLGTLSPPTPPHATPTAVFSIWYSQLVPFPYIFYGFHDYTSFPTVSYPTPVHTFPSVLINSVLHAYIPSTSNIQFMCCRNIQLTAQHTPHNCVTLLQECTADSTTHASQLCHTPAVCTEDASNLRTLTNHLNSHTNPLQASQVSSIS
jgi:hypothetical protein